MLDQQVCIERVRVVEIDLGALVLRQGAQVFIVGVVRQISDVLLADPFQDHVGYGCFPRAGTTR